MNQAVFPLPWSQFPRWGFFYAKLNVDGTYTYLGTFKTVAAAEKVYKKAKAIHFRNIATRESEPIRSALLRHADSYN